MAKSTGIILTIGGVTMFNHTILNNKGIDWRIPIATGFTAMSFSLLEKANEKLIVGVAWIGLLTVLLARVDPRTPSPTETMLKYWRNG